MVETKVSLLSLLEREYLGDQVSSKQMGRVWEAAPRIKSSMKTNHENLTMEVRNLALALLLPLGFRGDWTRWSQYIFKCVFAFMSIRPPRINIQVLPFLVCCFPWTYFIWGWEQWWTWWRGERWWLVCMWGCEALQGKPHDEEATPYSLVISSHLLEEII